MRPAPRGLDRLVLIRFLQVAQTITVHHGADYVPGVFLLPASGHRYEMRGHAHRSITRSAVGCAEQISSSSAAGASSGGVSYEASPDSTAVTHV